MIFRLDIICAILQSSVIVTGVPTKAYRLPTEWIQNNSTVVNVASFKNVDEEALLKIPGVVYVPMVGKVTVAMLERNLMRLYEQFHSPSALQKVPTAVMAESNNASISWRLHLYTAVVVTALLALQVMRK
jgi:methylenetetrahydrofolate dehydrogenase (NAD+)